MAVESSTTTTTTSYNTLADKLLEVLGKGIVEPQCGPCCIDCGPLYVFASVETYLKLAEAVGFTVTLGQTCCIETCLKELRIIVGEEAYQIFSDKGIVDHSSLDGGKSYLCDLLEYAKNNNATTEDIIDLVTVALDAGVVIYCDGDTKVTASVESFLKYAEAAGITCSAGLPPVCPLADIQCCTNIVASIETYLKYAEAVGGGPGPVPA